MHADVLEEAVACFGNVLGAALQHVHDADNGCQRRPQFVRGVLDELALAPARALALGDVFDDQDRGLGRRGWKPFDPEEVVVALDEPAARRWIGLEEPLGQLSQREVGPGLGQRFAGRARSQQPFGGRVRIVDQQLLIDEDDALWKLRQDALRHLSPPFVETGPSDDSPAGGVKSLLVG